MYIPRWTTYIVFLATTATISTNGALGRPVHYPMTYSHLQNSVDLPGTLLRVVFNHPSSDRPVSIEMEALAEVATMVAVKAHISGTLGDVGMMNYPNLPPGTRKSTFEVNGGRVCEKGCDGIMNVISGQ
ncbi:hypothetical protein EV360DRAFT_72717 [Lentinula raphanica]|nr:hypothetical protein EV360DRAFT_72717 [Lentinula raphanica]